MPRSFLQRLLARKKTGSSVLVPLSTVANEAADRACPNSLARSDLQNSTSGTEGKSLFAFVGFKDPYFAGEIAGEALPGPLLSIMSARKFDSLFLLHTPHTRQNAVATLNEVTTKYPTICKVTLHELPVSDPKDLRLLIDKLSEYLRKLTESEIEVDVSKTRRRVHAPRGGNRYVCVSSGTAEMRAAWLLVTALDFFPAKLLEVRSPTNPLFGEANVKEVRIDYLVQEDARFALAMRGLAQVSYFSSEVSSPEEGSSGTGDANMDSSSSPPTGSSDRAPSKPKSIQAERLFAEPLGEPEVEADSSPPNARSEGAPSAPKSFQPDRLAGWTGESGVEAAELRKLELVRKLCGVPGLDEALQELGLHVGSAVLRHAAERAAIAAGSHLPVLLLGETGTGKEKFAQLIHGLSSRSNHEMAAINCAAIPKELAESYLFGHMKGAFSGATTDNKGMFESADHSTLFLDEIAELTLEIQAKLLRVIQNGRVQRLGSTKPQYVNVRIIAATNRDLRSEVAAGRFREDLYFRLEVVQIKLPALRDRRHEIPELALALLKQINQKRQKPLQLSKGALQRLEQHHWPGNVRELSNVLERSVLYAGAEVIDANDLLISDEAPLRDLRTILPEPAAGFSIEEFLEKVREELFLWALEKCQGSQTEAALLLGVTRQAVNKFLARESNNAN